jgi:ribosomal protein S18 acetylase RimI-like enzyme
MSAASLTIRPAEISDVAQLHALIESAYRGDSARAGWTHEADLLETPRTSAETLAGVIGDPDELMLLFLDGPALVGCVQLTRRSPSRAYLGLLTVDPRRQAGGLGKRILAAAEAEAAQRFGADVMELSAVSQRAELIAYYQRRGYSPTGEQRPFPVAVDPPLTLLVLEKPLQPGA